MLQTLTRYSVLKPSIPLVLARFGTSFFKSTSASSSTIRSDTNTSKDRDLTHPKMPCGQKLYPCTVYNMFLYRECHSGLSPKPRQGGEPLGTHNRIHVFAGDTGTENDELSFFGGFIDVFVLNHGRQICALLNLRIPWGQKHEVLTLRCRFLRPIRVHRRLQIV